MLPEQEFKQALRAFIEFGLADHATHELLQKLEMQLASPGDWEAAKHHPLEETDKAEISD